MNGSAAQHARSRAFMDPWIAIDGNSSPRAPLAGLTFAVKDLIDIAGTISACGNPLWGSSHPPAAAHALCVQALLENGACLRGKTISDQFAFGLIGDNYFYGQPLNPRAPTRLAGGSSSGSASAVACGIVDFALGTDTGGSVRVPASNCGIYGFRPSHGLISVAGVMPFAPSFDTVGWCARDPEVLSRVGASLFAWDTPHEHQVPLQQICILDEAFHYCEAEEGRAKLLSFAEELARAAQVPLVKVSLASIDRQLQQPDAARPLAYWQDSYLTIQLYEIWNSLGSWLESAKPDLGAYATANFKLAQAASKRPELLVPALKLKTLLSSSLDRWFASQGAGTLLCIPSTPAPALHLSHTTTESIHYHHSTLALTSLASLSSAPELSIPGVELSEHEEGSAAPLGLSLLARRHHDSSLLHFACTVKGVL